jgi:uncharacterized tellurite resistance protein B-like protein
MFNTIKNILTGHELDSPGTVDRESPSKKLEVATCALFIELAYSDDEFSDEEKKLVYQIMRKTFGLNGEEMNDLLDLADEKMKNNISLYEYTGIINSHFGTAEKYEVLKNLWRLILVDGKLDAHEEYFIRKVSSNLFLEHKDLISAKMEVKAEMGL